MHFLPQLLDLSLPSQRADTQALNYLEGKTPGVTLPHDDLFYLSPGASQVAIYLTNFSLFTTSVPLVGVSAGLPLRYTSGQSSEGRIERAFPFSGRLCQVALKLQMLLKDQFRGVSGEGHS